MPKPSATTRNLACYPRRHAAPEATVYDETHSRHLSFIRRCRELGFALNQISGMLELVDGGNYTCAEVRQRTQAHLDEVQGRLADLRRMEKTLRGMVAKCDDKLIPECPIIDALMA